MNPDTAMKNHYQLLDTLRTEQQQVIDSLKFDQVKEVMRKHRVLAAEDSRHSQEQLSHCITLIALIPTDKVPKSIIPDDVIYYIEHVRALLQEMEQALAA